MRNGNFFIDSTGIRKKIKTDEAFTRYTTLISTEVVNTWEEDNGDYEFPSGCSHLSLLIRVRGLLCEALREHYQKKERAKKKYNIKLKFLVKEEEIEETFSEVTVQSME